MKNFILFALFCIVIIVGATFFSSTYYNDAIKSAEKANSIELKMVTETVASEVGNIFIESGRNVQLIAALFGNNFKVPKEKFSEIYYKYLKDNSSLNSFGYLNKKGIMEVIVPEKFKNEIGNNYSFRRYFGKAKATKNLIYSEVLENSRPKKTEGIYKTIVLALPVYFNNTFNGIFFGQLDVDKVQNLINHIVQTPEDDMINLYFYDQTVNTIVCDSEILEDKAFDDFLKKIISKNKRTFKAKTNNIYSFKGGKYFIEIIPVKDLSEDNAYFMIGIIPYSKAIGFFSEFSSKILFLTIFIALIVMLALVIVVYNQKVIRKLTNRIQHLEISINEVTKKQKVNELAESEYFKELQEKISTLKKRK
jgi:hypothetical protein